LLLLDDEADSSQTKEKKEEAEVEVEVVAEVVKADLFKNLSACFVRENKIVEAAQSSHS